MKPRDENYRRALQLLDVREDGKVYALTSRPKKPAGEEYRQYVDDAGYYNVKCSVDGRVKSLLVHRLVAMKYLQRPAGCDYVNHKSQVKSDNRVDNLEWCTTAANNSYGSRPARISKKLSGRKGNDTRPRVIEQLDGSGRVLSVFDSIREAERLTGVNHGNIAECCVGRLQLAGGYSWRYAGSSSVN